MKNAKKPGARRVVIVPDGETKGDSGGAKVGGGGGWGGGDDESSELSCGTEGDYDDTAGGMGGEDKEQKSCPGGHGLLPFDGKDGCDHHSCNGCGTRVPVGTTLSSCRACDFDLCSKCASCSTKGDGIRRVQNEADAPPPNEEWTSFNELVEVRSRLPQLALCSVSACVRVHLCA